MKHIFSISLGLSLIITSVGWLLSSNRDSLTPVVAAVSNPIANGQIIQISGEVQLERSQRRVIRPTIGTRVYPGDKLLTASGAQVVVQCADLSIQSVPSGQNRLNGCPQATEQAECNPKLVDCPHRGDKTAWNNNAIPYLISPRRTYLLNDQPLLRWNAVAGATVYTVTIEEDRKPFWQTTLSDTEVIYPGTPALKPGANYSLIVQTDTGVSSIQEEQIEPGIPYYRFSLLDEAQAQPIQATLEQIRQQELTDSAKALVIAQVYLKNDLISEAIETLEKVVKSGVQSAPIYRTLGELYWNYLELEPQAKDYYSKAVELADSEDIEEKTAAQNGLGQVEAALGNNDAAVDWLTQALAGYQALGDSERVSKLENQLKLLTSY
ncbi:MAG TPA: hypothetical protein DD379_16170 [Cyanobacteria bacterium UBA11162]|nr:hypothetical protein [Cyanobacteria bacterium UBA11162]